jgi:hypothetical protein
MLNGFLLHKVSTDFWVDQEGETVKNRDDIPPFWGAIH